MNYPISKLFLCVTSLLLFIQCTSNQPSTNNTSPTFITSKEDSNDSVAPYKILSIQPTETTGKAQIKCIAYLTSDTVTQITIEASLHKIYSGLQNYSNFKSHDSPTVIAIYFYSSKNNASNTPAMWLAMLTKNPSDIQPKTSFNDLQLNALISKNDTIKSPEEIQYDQLTEYFKKHNTDLCSIYKTLYDLEVSTIKQADDKYPDFGIKHGEYANKLYKQEKNKLFKKYNINDTLSSYITAFGISYCK